MTEVTYYIADDGTRFEDEEDCTRYEDNCKLEKVANDLVMFDCEDIVIKDACDVDDAVMIVIKTAEALKCFLELSDFYGCCINGIHGCGFYKWDYSCEKWVNVFAKINELRHAAEVAQVFECEFDFETED